MKNPWFRLYSEFASDPKVQSMPEFMQRRLIMLFCLNCSGDLQSLTEAEIAFALHISKEELKETKDIFQMKRFIDNGWTILNWNKRQFLSDDVTSRVQKHREIRRKKTEQYQRETLQKRYRNGNETPPDTDTEAERFTTRCKVKQQKRGLLPIHPELFDEFWKAYPRKVAKQEAIKAWNAVNPMTDVESIIVSKVHENIDHNPQWQKDDGQFIPHPATWLRQRRWLDEMPKNIMRGKVTKRTAGNIEAAKIWLEQEGEL